MCGIAGCIGTLAADAGKEALKEIRHRGPDSHGSQELTVAGVPVWLGHQRLSILDLSPAGEQPMRSRDSRWWVCFNGEIYNHLDLRRDLNVPWRGHSDTETLVEAIAAWGIERTLPRLNGMFAFAAVDTANGCLYLARDPFGVKPLYYYGDDGKFAFASEIGALNAITGIHLVPNSGELQTFLTLRYVPGPLTLFEGVFRLQPGHLLTLRIDSRTQSTSCFAPPESERFAGTIEDAVEEYGRNLRQAVKRQLLSDVPVGVLMSGGIDSAVIGAVAAESRSVLPAFTVGFGGDHPECEISAAAETAKSLGMPHHVVAVGAEELWDALELSTRRIEEPLGTTSILPMWYLVQRARREVKVVLTGQGSDEPLGGYLRYQGELLRNFPALSGCLRLANPWLKLLPRVPESVRRAASSMPLSDQKQRFESAYALFTERERRELSGASDSGRASEAIGYWLDWVKKGAPLHAAEENMRIDTRMNLADDLLLYGDKISMAHSLEARVPMLDTELVKFIESLPLNFRVTINSTKIVHRKFAARLLPKAVIDRPKRNFQIPFAQWSRGIWRDRIEGIFFQEGAHLNVLNRKGIEALWQQHLCGKRALGRQLFALLTLVLTLRNAAESNRLSGV